MINVPTKLATLTLANAIESKRMTLAVARLKRMRVSMNFQNVATSGTRPTRPYMIDPKTSGGTTRSGSISKRTCVSQSITVLDYNSRLTYLGCEVGERGVVPVCSKTNGEYDQLVCMCRNTDLSRMNNIRSLAKRPRLDRQEKPNRASVKKKTPMSRVRLS